MIVPVVCAVAFIRARRLVCDLTVGSGGRGENLVDLGPYIADARSAPVASYSAERLAPKSRAMTGRPFSKRSAWLHLDHPLGMAAHVGGSVVMIGARSLARVWCTHSQWSRERAEA